MHTGLMVEMLRQMFESPIFLRGPKVVWKYRASASTRASHQGRSRGSRVT